MANFLSSLGNLVKQTVWDQPTDIIKGVSTGDFGGAWDAFKSSFGDNNDGQEQVLNSLGIRGWVGSHPQETAGAVAGTIIGGMYALPAMATSGGTAGTAGTAGASGAGITGGTAGTTGAGLTGGAAGAYTPTASTVLGGPGSIQGVTTTTTSGGIGFTPTLDTASFGFGAESPMAYNPTSAAAEFNSVELNVGENSFDLNKMINSMKQLSGEDEQKKQQAPALLAAPKTGFNFKAPTTSTAMNQAKLAKSNNPFNSNPFQR